MPELSQRPDAAPGRNPRLAAAIVMGLPLLVMAAAALVLPAGLAYSLVSRGIGEGHPSWIALGGISGGIWLLMLRATVRKLGRAPKPNA